MKIKSFRIKNYRSIEDSGICYLSGDNVTILAGKNESGKTSILEALEDFDTDRQIRNEAVPLHAIEAIPEIAVTFELDEKKINEIFSGIVFSSPKSEQNNIEIIKKYPNTYSISHECIQELGLDDQEKIKVIKIFNEFVKRNLIENVELNFENIDEFRLNIIESELQHKISNFSEEIKSDLQTKYNDLVSSIGNYIRLSVDYNIRIIDIKQWVPNFILFSSFDDIFPSEISLIDAKNNELIKDLSIVSDLDLELITSDTPAKKIQHKEKLNVQLKADYKEYWTQDLTDLHIDWDSEKLYFFIKEDEYFYPPDKRSKGKQWHLAFYIKITARSKEDVSNVILIDEPGLFLHAKAQEDILRKLEDSANNTPIIFSTHSPYLIEIDKLNRIRLISRKEKGTTILNKIHKDADKETLTPIITAIGLDLSKGLDIGKDNNIIVEGMSDYFYLHAFIQLLNFKFKKNIHIIPIQGVDKFKFLIPLMIGWGLNYCVVLDNDAKGIKVEKELTKNFGHAGLKIIFISESKDKDIEDLFDRTDFIKYVLDENKKLPEFEKNSSLFKQKDNTFDKVLSSKLFYENTKNGDISLSTQTMENFQKILRTLNDTIFLEV